MTVDLKELTEDQIRAAHEEVWLSQAGEIVLADLEAQLDVFGADYVADDELAETPHPYRAYEERGMMRSLRRIRAHVQSLLDDRFAIVASGEPEEGEDADST